MIDCLSKQFWPPAQLKFRDIFYGGCLVDMALYERQFSPAIYDVATPAARRLYGSDITVHEPKLASFSRDVIFHRKGKYAIWVMNYIPRAAAKVLFFHWSLWLLIPAALFFAVSPRRTMQREKRRGDVVSRDDKLLRTLLWIAPSYFLASVAVLCTSGTYADSRIVVPSGVFFPPLLMLWCLRKAQARYGICRVPVADREAPASPTL